jgi:hypothetical protein
MTDESPRPQADHNFLVDLGARPELDGVFGFGECTVAGVELTVDPTLEAADVESLRAKIASVDPSGHVTLKAGVIDAEHLSGWLGGDRTHARTVRVGVRSADRTTTLAGLVFANSRILKFVAAPLQAEGNDVAVEELTITCDGIAFEDPASQTEPTGGDD